jgi:hypothetical protein
MKTYLLQGTTRCPPKAARLFNRTHRAASGRCDRHRYRHMYNPKQRPDAAYIASLPAGYGAQPAAW